MVDCNADWQARLFGWGEEAVRSGASLASRGSDPRLLVKSGAVQVGKWKAVIKDNEMSLYDLDTDIAETLDFAAKYPEVLERVRAFLKESVVPAN